MPEGDVYREMLEWDMVSGGSVALVRRGALEDVGRLRRCRSPTAPTGISGSGSRGVTPSRASRGRSSGYTRRVGSVSRSYDRMVEHGRLVLAKARRDDPAISDADYRAFLRARSVRRGVSLPDR